MCPNYLAPFGIVPSGPWPKVDVLLERIEWGRAFLELCQHQLDGWMMFEVKRSIVNFLLQILGVSLNSNPNIVYERPGMSKTLLKKSFEVNPRQGNFGCLALLTLILVPTKRNKAANRVRLKLVARMVCTQVILTLFKGLIGSLRVWDNWLQLGWTNPCKTLSLFERFSHVYLAEAGVLFLGSSSSSLLLCPTKRDEAFLWKQRCDAIAAKLGNCGAGFDIV